MQGSIPNPSEATFADLRAFLEAQIIKAGANRTNPFSVNVIELPEAPEHAQGTGYVFHADALRPEKERRYMRYSFLRNDSVLLHELDKHRALIPGIVATIPSWKEGILSLLKFAAITLETFAQEAREQARQLRHQLDVIEFEQDEMPPTIHVGKPRG